MDPCYNVSNIQTPSCPSSGENSRWKEGILHIYSPCSCSCSSHHPSPIAIMTNITGFYSVSSSLPSHIQVSTSGSLPVRPWLRLRLKFGQVPVHIVRLTGRRLRKEGEEDIGQRFRAGNGFVRDILIRSYGLVGRFRDSF
jgi:hypothetical protein